MEIPVEQVEELFDRYLKSPQLAKVGQIIEGRVGRKLEAFDIWYDGFKARSEFPQEQLNGMTTKKYPDPAAFEKDMPNMLEKLGWSKERAAYLASKIVVDPARGSGHAWGAGMKGEKAHLRTRIAPSGMDYKGYNIAVHEFGHNVEQPFRSMMWTISCSMVFPIQPLPKRSHSFSGSRPLIVVVRTKQRHKDTE